MKITLDIPDGILCGFFNGVRITFGGLQMVSCALDSDDMRDGNTIKLPRQEKNEWND
nr:MAG TPA: hypothetical protein [Caudoviricetes sp.]DAH95069.1 MAG TPA: hypothetical protein [Caudoviricetes sp.]